MKTWATAGHGARMVPFSASSSLGGRPRLGGGLPGRCSSTAATVSACEPSGCAQCSRGRSHPFRGGPIDRPRPPRLRDPSAGGPLWVATLRYSKPTLDDIDWRAGRIDLRQLKTGRPLALPLLPDVAQALSAYIRDGRPASSDRTIFLRHCAPFEPFAPENKPDGERARSPSARWPCRTIWPAGSLPVPPHTCHIIASSWLSSQNHRRCPGPCFHRDHVRVHPGRASRTPWGGHLRRGGEPMNGPPEASVCGFVSPLASQLTRFLALKHAMGYRYREEGRVLHDLDRFLNTRLSAADPLVTPAVVHEYVARRGRIGDDTSAAPPDAHPRG